ncbi:protein 5NUC-like, partial [Sitodiplosis mosellana]|uniref:protein 5NUC-like n=1 Tax=Sitodiplosis mosellana TaxID=263140 RepID=UPI002443844D
FDKDGNLLRWDGSPILLDNKIPRDPVVLELLAKYRPAVEALTNDIVGFSAVPLERKCTTTECNIGNLITDAWVYNRVQQFQESSDSGSGWTDASLALVTGGAIRSSAAVGNISKFTLSTIIPFNNTLFVIRVPGKVLHAALERCVQDYVVGNDVHASTLFQMSGARVVYDLHKMPGQRLQSVEVLCSKCKIPSFEPLNEERIYGVIIEEYIYKGIYKGEEGFTMFLPYKPISMKMNSLEAVTNYIKHHGLIYPAIENRIKFVGHSESQASTTSISVAVLAVVVLVSQLIQ